MPKPTPPDPMNVSTTLAGEIEAEDTEASRQTALTIVRAAAGSIVHAGSEGHFCAALMAFSALLAAAAEGKVLYGKV